MFSQLVKEGEWRRGGEKLDLVAGCFQVKFGIYLPLVFDALSRRHFPFRAAFRSRFSVAQKVSLEGLRGCKWGGVFTPFLDFCWWVSICTQFVAGGDGVYLLGGDFLGLFASSFALWESQVSVALKLSGFPRVQERGEKLIPGYRGSW